MDFEMLVQEIYELILQDGDIAVDAGAHVGRHAFPMAKKVGMKGKIFCFEPLPMCRDSIQWTIYKEFPELREIISLYPFALSDFDGDSEFVVAMDALWFSGLKGRKYDCETRTEKIPVTVKRLDDVLSDISSLRYIKIDAEGGELHILRGSNNLIDKFRPLVTFEFGVSSLDEYDVVPEDMFEYWQEKQYRIFDILGRQLTTKKDFSKSATIQEIWDYVVIPQENAPLLEKIDQLFRKRLSS